MPRKPHIILCSGQSNMARITPGIHWEPPKNLKVWGYSEQRHGEGVGDSFSTPATNIGNYANFYAAEVARNNPDKDVYVVNVSKGGTNLAQWLPGAESVNMMSAIKVNMNAAMQEIPLASAIDEIIWWGHESDAVPSARITSDRFIEMFNVVVNTLDEQQWIGDNKPRLRLHRLHPECNRLASQINYALECLVQQNPERICLSDTTHFSYTDNIHLDPKDKEAAAKHVFIEPVFDVPTTSRKPQANLLYNGDFSEGVFPWITKGVTTQFNGNDGVSDRDGVSDNYGVDDRVSDGFISLNDNGKLVQKIPRGDLQGKVVTLSVEDVERDLKVQIGNHIAHIYSGEGRRQAAFALHSVLRRKIRIAIEAVDGKPVTLSKIKLEFGEAATAYTHNSSPQGIKASMLKRARRLKQN